MSVTVLHYYDSNSILTETLKNHTNQELVRDQTYMIQYLLDQGMKPSALHIDNECPKALLSFFRAHSVNVHICPPNDHHTNQPEKAIDTRKCYFPAGINGLNPIITMHLWCCLLPWSTQTLKLLRRSWIKPRLPEKAHTNGAFDYNQTPMAPPGTKFLIHKTPQQIHTWVLHGKK